MDHTRTLTRLVKLADQAGVKLAYKSQSGPMRLAGRFLFFRQDFLTDSVTTWGTTIYFPSSAWVRAHPDLAWQGLAHGLVHAHDSRRVTMPLYALSYLFPQCLALLALLAPWWPSTALFLLALLPWPAPFRRHWESRASAMTLAVWFWQDRTLHGPPEEIVYAFVGPRYYWCWPSRRAIRDDMQHWLDIIRAKRLGLFLPHTTDVKFSIRMETVVR